MLLVINNLLVFAGRFGVSGSFIPNIVFDICALVFMVTIFIFFRRKNELKITANKCFGYTMLCLIVSGVFNLTSVIFRQYFKDHYRVNFMLLVFSYVFLITGLFCVFVYVMAVTRKLKNFSLIKYELLSIPAITSIISILLTPITKAIFYFDDTGSYIKIDGMLIIPLTIFFYCTCIVIATYIEKDHLKPATKRCLYLFSLIMIASGIFEGIVDNYNLILHFSLSFIMLLIYLEVQNPDLYFNSTYKLMNKEAFILQISESIDENIPFSCISLQIDEFNNLADIYGSRNCDQIVVEIGKFLRKSFPKASIFSISSSQIIIVDHDDVDFTYYERVIDERFSSKWLFFDTELKISKSMCCLSYPDYYGTIDELLSIIKFALEESFKTNSMVIVGDYIINKMNHNIAVEKAVEKAIEANAIQVYYQPIYSAAEKRITCAEALARLFDDELGFIPPDEFIRVAEENGSILRLGQQIFEKVCVFIKNNDLKKLNIHYIEVNLSPIQAMQKELATELIAIADSYGLPMSNFNLEITESATTESKDHVKINMEMLCNRSTTFSLDDYGTGFSNITAIMDLPFKYVKIDKSIVWAYFDNTNCILEHLVSMFKKENLYIITEGVETEEQVNKLLEMGCDFLQGFYFSKAIPGDDFISYVSA
ncbi:MAG: EAL domain-containing protein [Lachnospiraceae bacterium]|nr:EAL domain-containing protein [Lachnospiraceae bacterium]